MSPSACAVALLHPSAAISVRGSGDAIADCDAAAYFGAYDGARLIRRCWSAGHIFCLVPTAVLEYSAPENVPGNFLKKKSQAERAVYYAKRFLHSKLDYTIYT